MRIDLDYDNEIRILRVMQLTNRSAASIVNELLHKIEIVVPKMEKIQLEVGNINAKKNIK